MSVDHKAALDRGRTEAAAVRRYLEVLATPRTRGRRRLDRERLERRLAEIDSTFDSLSVLKRLQAAQARIDLTAALAVEQNQVEDDSVVEGFVEHAAAYGKRKGIGYEAWREVGVPSAVLKAAGITRG